jgi:hypothetical protein
MYGLEYIFLSIFILSFVIAVYCTWKYVIKDKKNKFITRMKKKDDNCFNNKNTEDITIKDIVTKLLCNVAEDDNDDNDTTVNGIIFNNGNWNGNGNGNRNNRNEYNSTEYQKQMEERIKIKNEKITGLNKV